MAHPFDRLDNEAAEAEAAAAAEEGDIIRRRRRRQKRGGLLDVAVAAARINSFYQAILVLAVTMLIILVVYALLNDVSHFKAIHTMMNMLNVSLSYENKSIVMYLEHFPFSIKRG
jgi:hypothetical protein